MELTVHVVRVFEASLMSACYTMHSGGIQHMSREPMKAVHGAMDESNSWMNAILTFMTNLVTPEEEEEEGIFHIELHSIPNNKVNTLTQA